MGNDTDTDPLQRVVVDKDEVNRERLADAIEGIIGVDNESGEPVPLSEYHGLGNETKFVARLLARRAALALDFIEDSELGVSSSELADRMEPSDSTIQNYGGLDFVDNNEDHGGYFIPGYAIESAIDYVEDAVESE